MDEAAQSIRQGYTQKNIKKWKCQISSVNEHLRKVLNQQTSK